MLKTYCFLTVHEQTKLFSKLNELIKPNVTYQEK
ncbi:hypothetical protein EcHS_A2078 [Escherichia coli HS]|nr:hypothetical protein EcHS_A2078 [Escherichia coli HS]